jgi:hypothetical protein
VPEKIKDLKLKNEEYFNIKNEEINQSISNYQGDISSSNLFAMGTNYSSYSSYQNQNNSSSFHFNHYQQQQQQQQQQHYYHHAAQNRMSNVVSCHDFEEFLNMVIFFFHFSKLFKLFFNFFNKLFCEAWRFVQQGSAQFGTLFKLLVS